MNLTKLSPNVTENNLKFSQVNIQSTIKTERSCDGGNNLTNQSVQVGVSWPLNVQVAAADVIDGLIVHHEGTVRVLQGGVSGQNGVVRLNNSGCNLWCWVDGKFQLGFLSIVNRETLHKQRCESRASTSTKRMEDEETLQSGALVSLCRKVGNPCLQYSYLLQFVLCDRPGECSSEKNCCWRLTFRQPERKSSSESSEWCLSVDVVMSGPLRTIGQLSHGMPWYWLKDLYKVCHQSLVSFDPSFVSNLVPRVFSLAWGRDGKRPWHRLVTYPS